MNLDVVVMNQTIPIVVDPKGTFESLITILLQKLNIDKESCEKKIIYVGNHQTELNDSIESTLNKYHPPVQVTLTKIFSVPLNHQVFGVQQFQCNRFSAASELEKNVNRFIAKKFISHQFRIKILVNGVPIDPKTIWHSLGQNLSIDFLIETTIQINLQGKIINQIIDSSWTVQQVILAINQQQHFENNILLMFKDQELSPESYIVKEKTPVNAVYSVKIQDMIKLRLQGAQQLQIEINNGEPISNLENHIQLSFKQTAFFKLGDISLDSNKTIKQEMIPYNSIITYTVAELQKIKLPLLNMQNQQIMYLDVNPENQLKSLETQLGIKNIQFFLNNQELIDKNQRLESIGLKRNQPLSYKIVSLPQNQELRITFLNTYSNNKTAFYVTAEKFISESFEKTLRSEPFQQVKDYRITFNNFDLNINQSYEKAKIPNESIINYYCLIRRIRYVYQQQVFEYDAKINDKLSDLENQWRQQHNIPNNFTILNNIQTVEQMGLLDNLEFKIKPKIKAIQNPQPMKILQFQIFLEDLKINMKQEIPANNQISGLADCVRLKLQLPKSSRIVFTLGQEIFKDDRSLDTIMDGQPFEALQAKILDHITVNFKNQANQKQVPQVVKIADQIRNTAKLLKIENSTFYYNNQIIQLNRTYEQLLILHNETIVYELLPAPQPILQIPVEVPQQYDEDQENEIHQPPDSMAIQPEQNAQPPQITVNVNVGGKTIKLQVEAQTTKVKELNQTLHQMLSANKDEKPKFGVAFNSQKLGDEALVASLVKNNEELTLDYIMISQVLK